MRNDPASRPRGRVAVPLGAMKIASTAGRGALPGYALGADAWSMQRLPGLDPEAATTPRPADQGPSKGALPRPGPMRVGPTARNPAALLALQRAAGNRATAGLMATTGAREGAQESRATGAEEPELPVEAKPAEDRRMSLAGATTGAGGSGDRPAPPAAAPARGDVTTPTVQRLGFLSGALSWVRDRWNGLRQHATAGVSALRGRISAGVTALQTGARALGSRLMAGLGSLREGGGALLDALAGRGQGLLAGVLGLMGAVGAAIVALDADRLRDAWSALAGMGSRAWGVVKGMATGALDHVRGLWNGLRGLGQTLFRADQDRAASLLGAIPGAVRGLGAQLGGLWSGIAGRVSGALRHLPGWSAVERLWSRLRQSVQAAGAAVLGQAQRAWTAVREQAGSVFRSLQSGWERFRSWAAEKAGGLVAGFQRMASSISGSAIGGLIQTFRRVSTFFKAIMQAINDPGSVVDPIARALTAKLGPLPERSRSEVPGRVQEASQGGASGGGGSPRSTGGGTPPAATTAGVAVQRFCGGDHAADEMTTASIGEVVSAVVAHVGAKVTRLMGNIGTEIKELLRSMVWPPATWRGLKQDWQHMTDELGKRVSRFRSIRLDSIGHFTQDLRRFVSNLADFPLIIWRTVNAMLGRLSVYITLLLVLVGGIAGFVGGTVGGAIVGFLGGAGVGAAPGAGGGGAIGFGAGAAAGWGAATALGAGVLVSFLAAEAAALQKSVIDLVAVPQSAAEQDEDASNAADGVIALVIAGLLAFATWIGTRIARALANIVRAIRARVSVRRLPPPVEEPPTRPIEPAVAGKAQLARQVAGSQKFAGRVRKLLDQIERPGARPALEARLVAIEEALARLERRVNAASTAEEIQALQSQRDALQRQLEALNRDVQRAIPRFPDSWDEFDERFHAEFERELKGFRGNDDLEPTSGLRGGEGQLFLGGPESQTLKRWFKARLSDKPSSISLLRGARGSVTANPRLAAVMDVVEVFRTGSDWALRAFDRNSLPLRSVAGQAEVAAARAEAIAACQASADPMLRVTILGKLQGNSANLHWSPGRGKILIIDMQ